VPKQRLWPQHITSNVAVTTKSAGTAKFTLSGNFTILELNCQKGNY